MKLADMRGVISILTVAGMLVALCAGVGVAQEQWQPPEPEVKGKDWVQLVSGEWVRGTIDLVLDEKMEFDSDELDDLVIDWRDVGAFRSPRILTYVFVQTRREQIVVTGTGVMQDGVIRIRAHDGTEQEFSRRALLKIIEGTPSELNFWSAKVNIGVTVREGNTEQEDVNSTVRLRREATRSRFDLDYTANYGKISGTRTVDNNRATTAIAFYLTRRFFVTPFAGELYVDEFQNIDYRATYSANAGYYIFRRGDLEWFFTLGGGYRKTRFLSVEAGADQEEETGNINPATAFEMDVTSDIELEFEYRAEIGVPDPKQTTHRAVLFTSIDFWKDIFELTLSFTFDRVESPKATADGIVPERNDYRLIFGFGIDL